ncbi:MAG: hypothetical protein AAFX87_23875 [Bacteroidota bacterium]
MIKVYNILSLLAVVVLLVSCDALDPNKPENLSFDADYKRISNDLGYEIFIPKYMSETEELNDEASLQYMNGLKETYMIVIDESKEDFISSNQLFGDYNDSLSVIVNYRNIQLGSFNESLNIVSQSAAKPIKIDGLSAETVDLEATVLGIEDQIFYMITFIEGKEKVYMILGWTLASRKNKYKGTFEQSINSFKEI